jgi:ParB-like chromosome segregation protein Spo0J
MIVEQLQGLAHPLKKLKLLPGNPRKGDVEAVKRSYERFGQRKPIVARPDGTVIAGNHQFLAAKALGWDEMAVVFVDDDDQTAKAFALADNRTSDLGTYDSEALAELLADVAVDPELLLATGYTQADLDALIGGIDEDDEGAGGEVALGEKYEVVIECDSEQEQEVVLLRLASEGMRVRAIIV